MAHFLAIFLSALAWLGSCEAKWLGVHGQLFPVVEENFLEWIQSEMAWAEDQFSVELREKLRASIEEPHVVLSLPTALKSRSTMFDPTLVLKDHVRDESGKILFARGTSLNPLDVVQLSAPLLFINGFDNRQIEWARVEGRIGKWILVMGRPSELSEQEGKEVYFDQGGYLVRKFGIATLPARVTQVGRVLLVEEIAMEESNETEDINC